MKSILILLASFNLMSTENGIYRIFYAVSDGVFFFLPFLLAITSSRQLKTNTFISLMVPIAFLYPAISETLENGGTFNLLCFKVPPAVYHSSVIPVLLAVGLLHFIEKPCDRLQEAVRGFLKPIICMAVVLPATFMIFGPAGTYIGAVLTKAFFSIYSFNPVAAGAFMGTIIQPMVSIGAHWAIVPVVLNNISEKGYDIIMPLLAGAVYGKDETTSFWMPWRNSRRCPYRTGRYSLHILCFPKHPHQCRLCRPGICFISSVNASWICHRLFPDISLFREKQRLRK